MTLQTVVAVPFLHGELYTEEPCSEAALKAPEHWGQVLFDLPLDPREVRAILADIRSMDADTLGHALNRAAHEGATDAYGPDRIGLSGGDLDERSALAAFDGTSSFTDAHKDTRNILRRRAQRLLLMGWVQEERVLDIRALAARYAQSAGRLASLLHEAEAPPTDTAIDNGAQLLLPWAFILAQLSWFAPADKIFLVGNISLCAALVTHGQQVPLSTLPDGVLVQTGGQQGYRCALRPLLGHWVTAAPAEALDAERLFIVYGDSTVEKVA